MNAPMRPDAPEWLVTLLAEHALATGIRDMRAHCSCGWAEDSKGGYGARQRHRAHVAAVVWAEFYRRMSEVNPDDNMLAELGADDD